MPVEHQRQHDAAGQRRDVQHGEYRDSDMRQPTVMQFAFLMVERRLLARGGVGARQLGCDGERKPVAEAEPGGGENGHQHQRRHRQQRHRAEMVRAVIGAEQDGRRTQPQRDDRDMQTDRGEIDTELPQRKHHEHDDQQHEHVDPDQQARQYDDDEHRAGRDRLRHVAPGLLIDVRQGLLGLHMKLVVVFHDVQPPP